MAGTLKKGPWSQDEDARLERLVEEHGLSWVTVSQAMGTRSADQLNHQPWQDHENGKLLRALATHGSSWKEIQEKHFPTRSANNVKNQYTILMRRGTTLSEDVPPCCPGRSKKTGASSSRALSPDTIPPPDAPSSKPPSPRLIQPQSDKASAWDSMSDNSYHASRNSVMEVDAICPTFSEERDHIYPFLSPMPSVNEGFNTDFNNLFSFQNFSDQSTVQSSDCPDMCTPVSAACSGSGVGVMGDNDSVGRCCASNDVSAGSTLSWPLDHLPVSEMDMDMGGTGMGKAGNGAVLSAATRPLTAVDSSCSKASMQAATRLSASGSGDASPRSRMTIVVDEAKPETLVEVMKVLMESQARVEFWRQ
ncbi:hypothetical protein CHGG_10131 [Chaetomium globosum CBS 148.51]|uniref:Uncharacterized protein n=1 Tax=Chaetomium globosum (strain ATCC 6205 / CBS 148.51 / DSM 1962 / NBRC 6347 / NRRL 1970) TaxID=306901 RepID=Q2GPH3_CHAGB|nr:uncharacterized protein CHGG_10131 [Chaetomium globosum CBS 148.51]EAQ83727.1 hypothetical protein CHGG_10131 [Chaetomium globosum CBS 148.51]